MMMKRCHQAKANDSATNDRSWCLTDSYFFVRLDRTGIRKRGIYSRTINQTRRSKKKHLTALEKACWQVGESKESKTMTPNQ
jgi:hypothetical protein